MRFSVTEFLLEKENNPPALTRICNIVSVCPSAWNNSTPTGRIFMKFEIFAPFFTENLWRKRIFMKFEIFAPFLLKICRENGFS